jgi:DedD protein
MASGGKRGGGDRIVESRHLVGLFLGVVLLCGVFFTLGYVMGRAQYGGPVHADAPERSYAPPSITPKAKNPDVSTNSTATASPPSGVWDFYPSGSKNPPLRSGSEDPVPSVVADAAPAAPAPVPAPAPAPRPVLTPAKSPAHSQPSRSAKPSYLLQIAALTHQSDALAESELLQRRHFPAFVANPTGSDKLYRVQVGPYADEAKADVAKTALDRAGFKAIIKH